ncbi:NADP-dependent oxidoreductase [Kutzneria sp. CA-103260]|uniref:NADP-dependent oxidoreductase n=1 Tax=Kutzneria sp. CA-103260 TaxID=2802641 RepID=UPI001BAD0793|nr:NADP-dependent oxidoreductase [Kutzneria sp. CA-103260]QUQ66999.1 NADPH:quinone reductase-dependent oxidoreductase [Kutzneria sp. CA-103260]
MKAQLLTAFGGVENFTLTEVPTPVPGPGQVLVRTNAFGVNSLECKIRAGTVQHAFPTPLPVILGKEIAGHVTKVGDGVTGLAVGDRVVGFADSGAYAEYAVARVEALTILPDALEFTAAVTLPVAVETATRGIAALGVQSGWTVVVNGATGAVGTAVVQLLAAQGVTVIGTASERNHEHLASFGATPIAYGQTIRRPVDAVYDVTGHGFVPTAIELTGDPRRVLTIADFTAARLGVLTSTGAGKQTAESFAPVLPLAAEGKFRTVIDRVFPFTDIAEAHTRSEQGHARGKIVVQSG